MVGQAGDEVNGALFDTEAEIGIEVADRGAVVFSFKCCAPLNL